jgi:predicted AAA+ superfamily ATPase
LSEKTKIGISPPEYQKHLNNLRRTLTPGKSVIIYGARRTGKTTLVNLGLIT